MKSDSRGSRPVRYCRIASPDVLTVERVLELGCEDGDAVQEEHEVEALLTLLAKAELAHYGEEVGRVQTLELLVEPARWSEVRQLELAA